MALLVQKFGGTSVGDLDRIRAVAGRISTSIACGDRVVVVLSAMSGETNRLLELGSALSEEMQSLAHDTLLASGEQVSIALLSIALTELSIPSQPLLGYQLPILTDSQHTKARILSIDTSLLEENLKQGVVSIVAGFQGVDESNHITTLGRGGSDTTAMAIAAALKADECQIFTDVKGVYTADPRMVKNARKLPLLSFEEMFELASLGSRVLHPRSVEFAGKFRVPLRVLSSFEEDQGTLIVIDDLYREESNMEKPVVSGVTFTKDEAKLTVAGVPDTPGVAYRILGPVSDQGIEVDMIVQNVGDRGLTDFTFTVHRADYEKAYKILETVVENIGAKGVTGNCNIVKVSIVGVGMRSHAGVAARLFEALYKESINILMISTSEIKISVVLDEKYLELAVRSIHEKFKLDQVSF